MSQIILLTNIDGVVWQRNIGAYQVANHCRHQGYSVQVIDFTNMFTQDKLLNTVEKFIDQNTIIIGLSTTFYSNENKKNFITPESKRSYPVTPDIRLLLTTIREKYKQIKIVAGGAKSYLVKDDQIFDAVFHGYSEEAFLEYTNNIVSNRKGIFPKINNVDNIDGATKHFDIENLSHTWKDNDCILPGETLPIEISRGCIFKCKFCSYPLNGKKKFDYLRGTEYIKQELLDNYSRFGTTNYFFTDDTFNDSTMKLEKLHSMITSLPFKIKFVTYLRLDLIHSHPEQITLLKEMGLGSAFFGIETLNYQSAKIIGKGMHSEKVKDFLVELHNNHWEKKIPFTCSFIIGLPEENKESIYKTYEWMKDKPFLGLWFPLRIIQSTHYQSEFDLDYQKYGYILNEKSEWTNKYLNSDEARDMSIEFNNYNFANKAPAAWYLFTLLSHGYSFDDLLKVKTDSFSPLKLALQKKKLFTKYYNLLMSLKN